MRKTLYALLIFCPLLLASVYLFIPKEIIVSNLEHVESSERIIAKYLNSDSNRRQWWPLTGGAATTRDSSALEYVGYKFDFETPDYNFNEVIISNNNLKAYSIITWDLSDKSLITIRWRASIQASHNPIMRVLQYIQAHKLKGHMTIIMENLLAFIVNSKNVYGLNIERSTIQDTILATSSMMSVSYPETPQVYKRIAFIKKHLQEQRATQVNPPMLNISRQGQKAYQAIIAIPANKIIKPDAGILINRMVAGNSLVAEIKGGPHTIAEGLKQMKIYLKDFKLISPAMPFESLVTDRLAEPDTSKWVTKIYYPIY